MANGTAEDVAAMESEIALLRTEVERLDRELAIVKAERSRLQIDNALLDGRAREHLVRATRIETVLRQVANGLVGGLKQITEERDLERDMRKQRTFGDAAARRSEAVSRTAEYAVPPKNGRVDLTLANRDARLPSSDFVKTEKS